MTAKGILFVQLLDDLSGSAKILSEVVEVAKLNGHRTHVIVGSGGDPGFIRRRHAAETVPYDFCDNRLRRLLALVFAQTALFRRVTRLCRSGVVDIVYVNTVLPAGAIVAGAFCRVPVVTHVHEVGMGSRLLFTTLLSIATRFSSRLIAVSRFVAHTLGLPTGRTSVVPNSLGAQEWALARAIGERRRAQPSSHVFRVMMASSLKWYKGVHEFVALARYVEARHADLPVEFVMILNCDAREFERFGREIEHPRGLRLVRRPPSMLDEYRQADLVVNLSLPEGWVETFGMTLLEAMTCGVPVVAPIVGGCAELFEPGIGGWRIDSRDVRALADLVARLATDADMRRKATVDAMEAAARFSPSSFAREIEANIQSA